MRLLCQRLSAKNDVNGNPRRVYVVYWHDGEVYHIYDEGYQGYTAVPADVRANIVGFLMPLDISPSKYRELLRKRDSLEAERKAKYP